MELEIVIPVHNVSQLQLLIFHSMVAIKTWEKG